MITRLYRMGGFITLPSSSEPQEGSIQVDGRTYMLGPALYEVRPAAPAPSIIGEAAEGLPGYDVVYVPYQQWPPGLTIDNAVALDFSPPVDTKEEDDG